MSGDSDYLDLETFEGLRRARPAGEAPVPTLTVLAHPQASRVGARARLPDLSRPGGEQPLSRVAPRFDGRPLSTPGISRKPIVIGRDGGGVWVDGQASSTPVAVAGAAVAERVVIAPRELDAGVVVELGEHVVLLLHLEHEEVEPLPRCGMVGDSDGIRAVRAAVARHGPAAEPVLVRGETGTGKELVARAVHTLSARKGGPLVAVNMAAIAPDLAAAELFGHVRGAFSGASEARDGFFVRADGGTLFMDEIGTASGDVQAALLRVLESGEIQPVGARKLRAVDVRLVAATDLDLEAALRAERLRAPLYYRLAAREIWVPPLRERRADIGRLLVHFLDRELTRLGRAELLDPPLDRRRVWLPGALVARLARYDWPGNVRQLGNLALWLVGFADADVAPHDHPDLARLLREEARDEPPPAALAPAPAPRPKPATATRRHLEDVGDAEVLRAMEAHDYRLGEAAQALGVSRPSMNTLIERHPELARAVQLSRADIEAARATAAATGAPLWRVLKVSRFGLKRRLNSLGMNA